MEGAAAGAREPRDKGERLAALIEDPSRAAVMVDFDGTLSEIAPRPQDAVAVPGAKEALERLAGSVGAVAVISGRRSRELEALLGTASASVELVGLYGLDGAAEAAPPEPPLPPEDLATVELAVADLAGTRLEPKGPSVAVHYRQAADPHRVRLELLTRLAPLAVTLGLELIEGKKVVELVPAGRPRKDGAVLAVARRLPATAVLYAGDDLADMEAFEALDALAATGVEAVRVAVRGAETPVELLEAADLIVDGPVGTVLLLQALAAAVSVADPA